MSLHEWLHVYTKSEADANNTLGLVLFLFTKPVLRGWVILLLVWGDDHLTERRVMAIQQTSHMAVTTKQNLFNLLDRLWPSSQVMFNRCQERRLGYLLEQKHLGQLYL